MNIKQQIKVIEDLLEATKELNEYQDGWDEEIQQGESLLRYLKFIISDEQ